MTKFIWLGEDTEEQPGPSFCIWNGIKFPKDKAVEVTDPYMLGKIGKGNRFFKVIEDKKQEKSHGESQTQEGQAKREGEAKEGYDYRSAEKGSGYSPVKKKVRKKKAPVADVPVRTASDP